MTASFDEDFQQKPANKSLMQPIFVRRAIIAGAVGAVVVLYYQLMPGGLLADTGLGQAVQNIARAVARTIATVSLM